MTFVFAVVVRKEKTTRSAACALPRTFSPSSFTLICRVGPITPVCVVYDDRWAELGAEVCTRVSC